MNEVVENGKTLERAHEVAEEILACSPLSIRASKDAVYRSLDFASLEDSMAGMREEYAAVRQMVESEDFIEGPKAFAEKDLPTGRALVMKLYHCRNSRSVRPMWALEELGLSYDLVVMPFPPRFEYEGYLDINPLGTVPTFIDGDTVMTDQPVFANIW